MMRRLALAAAVVLALPSFALAGDGRPQYSLNARDTAWAKESLVRRSQLPSSYRPDPKAWANMLMPRCPGLYTPDRSDLTVTGRAESFYTTGGDAIGSHVTVLATFFNADAYWKRVVRPQIATCIGRMFAAVKLKHGEVTLVSAKPVRTRYERLPLAMYRVILRYSEGGRVVETDYRDLAFVKDERAIGSVMGLGIGHPCPCVEDLALRMYTALSRNMPH